VLAAGPSPQGMRRLPGEQRRPFQGRAVERPSEECLFGPVKWLLTRPPFRPHGLPGSAAKLPGQSLRIRRWR
jgi:hypothetical protein